MTVEKCRNLLNRGISDEEFAQDSEVYEDLYNIINGAMLLPDTELLSILNINEYPENVKSKNICWFYIRSWELPNNIFKEIVDYFVNDDSYSTTINRWLLLQETNLQQSAFFIRYVGMCKFPSYPIKRYEDDIKTRTNGFMANLLKKVLEIEPSILENHKIYTLDPTAVSVSSGVIFGNQNSNIDLQEQMLVSLFGLDNLLNSQPGGLNQSY
jgi:hypothetical protein